jgi:hypothetical protein
MLAKIVDENGNEITATNPLNVTIIGGSVTSGGIECTYNQISSSTPTGHSVGETWFQSDTGDIKISNGTTFDMYMDASAADPVKIVPTKEATAANAHRSAIAAVDKLALATITSAVDQTATVGVMANTAHNVRISAGNRWGTSGISTATAVTPTLNKTVDLTIAPTTGAEWYDIFFSVDAAPLWVARVTAADVTAGKAVTAVGVVEAGGSAGVINLRLVGTGAASTATQFSINNAYTPATPTVKNCAGYSKAYCKVVVAVTDLRSAPTLALIPFYQVAKSPNDFCQGEKITLSLLGATGQSLCQTFVLDVDSEAGLVILVDTISGEGTAATIYVELA